MGGLLVTLIYTLNYQLGIVEKHEAVTVGTLLAKKELIEMEDSPVSRKGTFGEPFSSYTYETGVKQSPYIGISEITVVVRSGDEEVRLNEFVIR